ncbi:MAG: hypothetical protein FWE17_01140 [Alphaproteobacteria bacterium]|nr:hypothetical protein [Alphaproteobacteria bacterium]MCL2757953.1 hypothetical protein [Alphaproteobacteria bacterium]
MAKKQIEVIDMGGAKTVAKKTSWVKKVKIVFLIISILWLGFAYWAPLHVKDVYGTQIKKSIVVSMFFDLQRNINEQYEKLLRLAARNINLEKPIAVAIDKVKIAETGVARVEQATAQAQQATATAGRITGIAGRVGVNVGAADRAVDAAAGAVAKVDDQAQIINKQLDRVKGDLTRIAQTEIDRAIDEQLKAILDQHTGLGTTMLTDYGIRHVMPWRPSTWPVTNKIYADLERSNLSAIQSLTGMVDRYFGYVAWGLVFAAWGVALLVWFMVLGKVRKLLKPFLVCPRCGHTYADKRTALMLLKVFQPWSWI